MRRAMTFWVLALTAPLGLWAADVPASVAVEVRETVHGVEIVDEYRWLEGSAAPEIDGEDPDLDARVSSWTDAQNAYTRTLLDGLPGREKLEERLRQLMELPQVGTPDMRRNRYFTWIRISWTSRVSPRRSGPSPATTVA